MAQSIVLSEDILFHDILFLVNRGLPDPVFFFFFFFFWLADTVDTLIGVISMF